MKKKIILVTCVLLFNASVANAGILSNIFGRRYYYSPGFRYTKGNYYRSQPYYNDAPYSYTYRYKNRYYNKYPDNYYRRPSIYRTNVKKSLLDSREKLVSNQISDIDKLEKQILLQTYEYDSEKNRIERLEQRLFGASQEGDLQERVSTLKHVAQNYKSSSQDYSNSYRPPVFTGSTGSSWRNTLLGNFKNQFIGIPTGFTPAMDPAYMDYFEAERIMTGSGQEVDVQTNTGYRKSNTNRGMTTGVTILD